LQEKNLLLSAAKEGAANLPLFEGKDPQAGVRVLRASLSPFLEQFTWPNKLHTAGRVDILVEAIGIKEANQRNHCD
jgi:hypothetical protein